MHNHLWILVDTPEKMSLAGEDLRKAAVLCIDTEYDSFRYFHDKLCLIQIRTDYCSYLFDPLGAMDISFLGEIFIDDTVLKILHAGDNDIRLLRRDYGFSFANIFDTHRAAALLGNRYLSLAALLREYLAIDLEKKKHLQRSQWDKRPLSGEQLNYAVLDTAYLKPLYEKLAEQIRIHGLEEEAARAFVETSKAVWHEKYFDTRGYQRIKAYPLLSDEQKRRLKKMFIWRFQKARELNRAIFMVLSEQELVNLVKLKELSLEGLKTECGFSSDRTARFGTEILDVLSRQETPADSDRLHEQRETR